MGPKSHHKLPDESTIARETEDAIKTSSCQIWIEKGASVPSKEAKRIQMEFHYSPYDSVKMQLQDMFFGKVESPVTCCIVYIRSFANSGHDFVYCVSERTHLSKFYSGTYGARDYRGPILGTLVVLAGAVVEKVGPINWRKYTKVPKYAEKINGVRWRYLFATARRVWSTMTFCASKLQALEVMVADVPVQQQQREPEARALDPISDSKYLPEAQRIAIQQNVEILKNKPNHQDRVFEYLERELIGWCNQRGKDELTKQQYRLVARLRDNADDFGTLYNDEDEDGNTVPNTGFNKDEEARLISERDVMIRQIQEQLALPISVCDDPDRSELPGLEPSNQNSVLKDTEDSDDSDDDILLRESMDTERPTKEQAKLIQRFANFTGAQSYQCEGYLYTANWDLNLALSYFQEDHPTSKPSISRNTNNLGPKERIDAVTTFKALTNADSAVATSCLTGTGWDVGLAVSTFFDDSEAPMNNSEGIFDPTNTASQEFSAKINKRPKKDMSLDTSDVTEDLVGEQAILNASLKATIRHRIAELDAEISKLDKKIGSMDDDGVDTIMQDVVRSEMDFNEDSEVHIAPRGRLRVVNEDPPQAVANRIGISHAGLPIALDEAGNVISYERPTGTPYQQYLAMRCRLQVQHYGYEAVSLDEDPHRGIPTRERCPAPLVQEEVDDISFSSSEDNLITPKDTVPSTSQESVDKEDHVQNRWAALHEMADLINMLAASEDGTLAKVPERASAANTSIQLEDQVFSWARQSIQDIQFDHWQVSIEGEGDKVDSVLDSADEHEAFATDSVFSTKDADRENRVPIKTALRDTSQPRKSTMKVRFKLEDYDRDAPTTWNGPEEEVEEGRPRRGRSARRNHEKVEISSLKVWSDAAEDENIDARAQRRRERAQKKEAEARKKRDLFFSKQEDAWHGLDNDENQLEFEFGSDVDAEGEEDFEIQEVQKKHEEQVEVRQEKDKRPPRVDEKMED